MSWAFERVAGPYAGEMGGVVWDGEAIIFIAVDEGLLIRLDPKDGSTSEFRRYANRTRGLGVGPNGELYGAQEGGRRIIQFMPDGSVEALKGLLDGKYNNNPSDVAPDSEGRVWFCDPHHPVLVFGPTLFPPLPHASVLRLQRNERRSWIVKRVTFDTVSPRALALSADERTLFVADGDVTSPGLRELRAYDIRPDGSVGPYRLLQAYGSDRFGAHRGVEGMCLDAQGNIVACSGWERSGPGPLVQVITPDGGVIESHPFPADQPVRCAFGGAGLDSLYVTTAGGEVYRAHTGERRGLDRWKAVRSPAEPAFAGANGGAR